MKTEDADTVAYFDEHVPEYSTGRLGFPAEFIREHRRDDSAIVDIGCGAGNTLAYLSEATGIEALCGLDVSEKLLERTRQELPGAETHLGSILDRKLVDELGARFDFAIIAAVLHHLVGRNRSESHANAALAVSHALDLLRPGGHLIVVDEAFSPRWATSGVFWVKKAVTRLTSKRVGIFGYWNNIGPPVVSYYNRSQLLELTTAGGRAQVVDSRAESEQLSAPAGWLLSKDNLTLIAQLRPRTSVRPCRES